MNTKQKEKISPKEYNEFLRDLDLHDVYLKGLKTSIASRDFSGGAMLELGESTEVIDRTADSVTIQVSYSLKAKTKKRKLFDLSAKYYVLFHTRRELPEQFFDKFRVLSLPLQTFPYFRELVNSTISRMGLPPLVLPLRKYLVGGPDTG